MLLPERNRKDLVEVPEEVRKELTFHFVSRIDEVLDLALERDSAVRPVGIGVVPAEDAPSADEAGGAGKELRADLIGT